MAPTPTATNVAELPIGNPSSTPDPGTITVRSVLSLGSRALTASQADEILAAGANILDDDGDGEYEADMSCVVDFSGELKAAFPDATRDSIAPASVSLADWTDVDDPIIAETIHNLEGNVKIVRMIEVCETIGAGIMACAHPTLDSAIVATWANEGGGYGEFDKPAHWAAKIWLHEIGHTRGLVHRATDAAGNPVSVNSCVVDTEVLRGECDVPRRPVMCDKLSDNSEVCPAECGKYQTP